MNAYRRAKVAISTLTHATSAECVPESSEDSALRRTVAKGATDSKPAESKARLRKAKDAQSATALEAIPNIGVSLAQPEINRHQQPSGPSGTRPARALHLTVRPDAHWPRPMCPRYIHRGRSIYGR